MVTKKCSKCKEVKEVNEFNIDKQKKDGRRTSCKVCSRKEGRLIYSINVDTEVGRAKLSKRIDNKEAKKEYDAIYRKENKERIKERQREAYRSKSLPYMKKQREKVLNEYKLSKGID